MKKITFLTLLSFLTLTSIAQNKLGHINAQEILILMPEFKNAEIKLQDYQMSLQKQLESSYAEYQEKEQEFKSNESGYDELVKNDKIAAIQDLITRIQKFEKDAQNQIQQKELDLLTPINKKLKDAIKEVASEGNYTYIFTSEILHHSAESNDIGPLVKKKLKL
ncbi:MAG: OmpH family outer membrane protein [Cryomorphaceae bacterium]|nr:OmpH family outer membrane protein [Cryomorphaceae bacterium]